MTTYCHVANGAVDNRALFDGEIPADWPDHDNWIASEDAQIGWSYADGSFTAPPPPPAPAPTGADVDAERERRIGLPLTVTLSVGSIPINMDDKAQRNLQGLATVGQYLTATGSSQTTTFRDYDNTDHDLTPADLVSMGLQVAAHVQSIYAKSWALKAMNPIPADYADDKYW
jgi:alkanesulfonate monooxygenase SsuD/methylene tetrahydromethanopterin reductase-like flavin-dependent oxidoreductase (luciferase family)